MKKSLLAIMTAFSLLLGASSVFAAEATTEAGETGEVTIVDNEYCTFVIKSTEIDSMWGYTWNVYIENKTDTSMTFYFEGATINGLELDPLWAEELGAGLKKNDDINWMEDFSKYGIDEVVDVDFKLKIYNGDDYSMDPYVEDYFTYNPSGEDVKYERESEAGDQVLYDDDNISIIVTETNAESYFGYAIEVYLVNKTDTTLMFGSDEGVLNGYEIDPLCATTVMPNASEYTTVDWMEDDLKDNGITDIESIGLKFVAYDYDDWSSGRFLEQTFDVTP